MSNERKHEGELNALTDKDLMQLQYSLCDRFVSVSNKNEVPSIEIASLAHAILAVNEKAEERIQLNQQDVLTNTNRPGTSIFEHMYTKRQI